MNRSGLTDTPDAFGGILVREDGKILLREPKGHYGGYVWTFAKGGANAGGSAEDAALREVHEETGTARALREGSRVCSRAIHPRRCSF